MTLHLRTSERQALKRCPQKWAWAWRDGLTPIRAANPLWFGAAVHEALAAWYLPGTERGPHPAETFDESLKGDRSFLVGSEEEEKEYADARELGVDLLEHYVEHYGTDDQWHVIATEQPFRVWVPHPRDQSRKRWLRHVGTFDGVYRDLATDEILLMEHKTAASINPSHLPLDDQAGGYWAIANSKLRRDGTLKKGEEISGIQFNFLRKALRDTRPRNEEGMATNKPLKAHYVEQLAGVDGWTEEELRRKKIEELDSIAAANYIVVLGEVSKVQPPRFFERFPIYRSRQERATMIRRIQEEALYAERWRAGDPDFPIFKTPVAMGPQACQWSCPFYRMCLLHEQGDSGWEEFRDTMFNVVDPYAAHDRKSADL